MTGVRPYVCSMEDCERQGYARGWCEMHWKRWRKHGSPSVTNRPQRAQCAVDDCKRPATGRGWCGMHYARWRRTGDPLKVRLTRWLVAPNAPWRECVIEGERGCLIWQGRLNKDGYACRLDDRPLHRIIYQEEVAAVSPDLHLDHLCRNRACVNPDHLEPVTPAENVLRGDGLAAVNARKTHCIHGHEFTPENTYVWRGSRHCRACGAARDRRRRTKAGVDS